MRLGRIGEFALIRRLARHCPTNPALLLGIGDDAAVLSAPRAPALLWTTDLLVEGIHFRRSWTRFYDLGAKAIAVNLSDVAAMGGTPRHALVSLALPAQTAVEEVEALYRGCRDACLRYGVSLAGGDTSRSPKGVFLSVSVLGVAGKGLLRRSGARAGDVVFVTGTLGDAAAGLALLRAGRTPPRRRYGGGVRGHEKTLMLRHLHPLPPVGVGGRLCGLASAAIDVSDGLVADLGHLCRSSGVGAEIRLDAVPLSPSLLAVAPRLPREALAYALHGGEDYQLLFTVPPQRVARLRRRLRGTGVSVTAIGTVVASPRCVVLRDARGRRVRVLREGYEHFRREESP